MPVDALDVTKKSSSASQEDSSGTQLRLRTLLPK